MQVPEIIDFSKKNISTTFFFAIKQKQDRFVFKRKVFVLIYWKSVVVFNDNSDLLALGLTRILLNKFVR